MEIFSAEKSFNFATRRGDLILTSFYKKVDYNYDKIENLVNYLHVYEKINKNGSVLIFNPVPRDKSIEKNLIDKWIQISMKKAKVDLISGKDLTPFLISEMNFLSKNETLKTNMELITNNALLAGKLAAEYF